MDFMGIFFLNFALIKLSRNVLLQQPPSPQTFQLQAHHGIYIVIVSIPIMKQRCIWHMAQLERFNLLSSFTQTN